MNDNTLWWPTETKLRLSQGRLVGVDGSMWAYRVVPMLPVKDARDDTRRLQAAAPIDAAIESLATHASTTMMRRALNRGSYREIHILTVNVPNRYQPPPGVSNSTQLVADFGGHQVLNRVCLFGVKLVPHMRRKNKGPVRAAVDSVAESLVTGTVPLEDYEADFDQVDAIMNRAGLVAASADVLQLPLAWWNFGQHPDTPMLVHADHLHVFRSVSAMRTASQLPLDQCDQWNITGAYATTMATVASFDTDWREVVDPRTLWGADLLDAGALAISVRGLVEPSKVTAGEVKRNITRYQNDINDRVQQGKQSKAEQEHDLAVLEQIDHTYAATGGAPTLTNTQVTVALDGVVTDMDMFLPYSSIRLGGLPFRQRAAMREIALTSAVRANMVLHDVPSQTVAAAGLASLSTVGDKDGALLGFTERDRQPAYISPSIVSDTDQWPILAVAGATGSGKTMVALHLARQWASIRNRRGELTPGIIFDPKPGSDFSEPVKNMGGRVYSLDDLAAADGVFDPFRIMDDPANGIDLASAMLGDIDPWPDGPKAHEVPVLRALRFGAENGARSVGQALQLALQHNVVGKDTVHPIQDLLDATPVFRAIFGTREDGDTLRASEGLNLIKVGSQPLTLPQPGEVRPSLIPRISQWVLRMGVYGSAAAVRGRQGFVALDEAHFFVGGAAGAAEVERLGRMARSMQVLPVLLSQRMTDFTNAGLSGYISRGIILGLERGRGVLPDGTVDDGEAGAALDLFRIAHTGDRLGRMSAPEWVEGTTQPNPASLKALRDPNTREVIRGSVAYYVDLSGRVVPVEVTIPSAFLQQISTNALDMHARNHHQ